MCQARRHRDQRHAVPQSGGQGGGWRREGRGTSGEGPRGPVGNRDSQELVKSVHLPDIQTLNLDSQIFIFICIKKACRILPHYASSLGFFPPEGWLTRLCTLVKRSDHSPRLPYFFFSFSFLLPPSFFPSFQKKFCRYPVASLSYLPQPAKPQDGSANSLMT